MELFLTILLDILVTLVAYLCVPVIFCLKGKELTQSKIKKIVIINGVSVWLVFAIIKASLDIEQTSAAVFLWSFVAYQLMTKMCKATETEYKPKYRVRKIETEKMSLSFEGETNHKQGKYCGKDLMIQNDVAINTQPSEDKKEHIIEQKTPNPQVAQDVLTDEVIDIVLRIKTDEDFRTVVKTINTLDKEKLTSLLKILQ